MGSQKHLHSSPNYLFQYILRVGTANGAFTGINANNQPFSAGVLHGSDYFNGRVAEFRCYTITRPCYDGRRSSENSILPWH